MNLSLSLIVLTVFFGLSAESSVKPSYLEFACVTQYPTTSFITETVGQKVDVHVINHNGVKYMPIHSGLVTINDIKLLTDRAQLLKNFGAEAKISFDIADCDLHQDSTFSCYRGGKFTGVDGKEIEVFSMSSSFNQIKFSDFVIDSATIMMGLIINDQSYYVQMDYQPEECNFVMKPVLKQK